VLITFLGLDFVFSFEVSCSKQQRIRVCLSGHPLAHSLQRSSHVLAQLHGFSLVQ
jgi:hypothetical protein